MQNINSWKKGMAFLQAKFDGKKWGKFLMIKLILY